MWRRDPSPSRPLPTAPRRHVTSHRVCLTTGLCSWQVSASKNFFEKPLQQRSELEKWMRALAEDVSARLEEEARSLIRPQSPLDHCLQLMFIWAWACGRQEQDDNERVATQLVVGLRFKAALPLCCLMRPLARAPAHHRTIAPSGVARTRRSEALCTRQHARTAQGIL